MCSVEGDDDHITVNTVCDACCIHSVHCTVCFVIVLAYYYVEIAVRFDEGLHNFLSACLCKVTGLRIKDRPLAVLSCDVVETFCTSQCCGCAYRTFDHKDVSSFAVQVLSQPVTSHLTFSNHVAANLCLIQRCISVYGTVNDQYRNTCVLSLLKNCVPTCCLDRSDADVIHLLLDESTNCL